MSRFFTRAYYSRHIYVHAMITYLSLSMVSIQKIEITSSKRSNNGAGNQLLYISLIKSHIDIVDLYRNSLYTFHVKGVAVVRLLHPTFPTSLFSSRFHSFFKRSATLRSLFSFRWAASSFFLSLAVFTSKGTGASVAALSFPWKKWNG
jgi:hypothetical protein